MTLIIFTSSIWYVMYLNIKTNKAFKPFVYILNSLLSLWINIMYLNKGVAR